MAIKDFLFPLIFMFGLGSPVNGQMMKYDVRQIPAPLMERADATVRHEQLTVTMKSDKLVETKINRTVTIHNAKGEEHANIQLYYNKSTKIKKVVGEILNKSGAVIGKFSLKDFRDHSATGESNLYDETRVKSYQPSTQTFPYTITYTLEITSNQNLVIPAWQPDLQFDVSVEQSCYTFIGPVADKIRFYQREYEGDPVIQENAKTKTYHWEVKNIQATPSEPFSPPRHLHNTSVRIVPEFFQYYRKYGQFSDWQEFGKWQYEALLADKRKLPEETILKVQGMLDGIASPKEKARILYQYLQQKTRYISIQIGIGGLEPFPAETVDRLGYGDCKALVNYMQSLLDIAEIPSYYCIVEAGSFKKDITEAFANVSDGNHIILCIPFENDTTWLECTNSKAPFGYLGDFTDDRLVIACSAEGGKLLRTPKFENEESLQYREGHFDILADGSIEGTIQTLFTGTQLDNHYYNVFLSPKDQQLNLSRWYDIDNIHFIGFKYETNFDSIPQSVKESMQIHVKNYGVISGKYFIIQPNIFNWGRAIPASKNRNNPIFINRGYTDIDILHFTIPEHWDVNIQPFHKKIETDLGIYELRISIENQTLICYRKFQQHSGDFTKEKYTEWHTFMNDVYKTDRIKFTLPTSD